MTTTVTIGGLDVSTDVLEGVTIRYGRDGLDGTVPASTCTLQLLALEEAPMAVQLRDRVQVKVDGTTLFYGKVTDTTVGIDYVSAGRIGTIQRVIAAGSLSELGRIFAGSVAYPSELDGARASRILLEAAPLAPALDAITTPIDEYALSPDYWASAGTETIDTGTVTLLARDADLEKASDLLQVVTESAGAPGVYETPDGRYGYADAARRSKAPTALTIPADVVDASLEAGSGVGDLVNTVTVSYGSASPQATVTDTDAYSVYAYGTMARSITTQLANSADASDLADLLVSSRSQPQLNLESVTVDLTHPDLSPSLYTNLLAPRFGSPITLTGLDSRIGLGTTWRGFVEGWTAVITRHRHTLTLNVSARRYSLQLATVDDLSSTVDRLEGAVDGLAELWAPVPNINAVSDTINSVAITLDRAYNIGA